jgi:hypothetical protein
MDPMLSLWGQIMPTHTETSSFFFSAIQIIALNLLSYFFSLSDFDVLHSKSEKVKVASSS